MAVTEITKTQHSIIAERFVYKCKHYETLMNKI